MLISFASLLDIFLAVKRRLVGEERVELLGEGVDWCRNCCCCCCPRPDVWCPSVSAPELSTGCWPLTPLTHHSTAAARIPAMQVIPPSSDQLSKLGTRVNYLLFTGDRRQC